MPISFIEPLLDTLGPLLRRREDEDVAASATNASIARLDERIAAQIDALSLNDGVRLAAYSDEHALAVVATWVTSAAEADHRRAWQLLITADVMAAALLINVVLRHGGPAWRQFAAAHHEHILGVICGELAPRMTWLQHPAPVVRQWTWRHLPPEWSISDTQLSLALADSAVEAACVTALCQRRDPRLASFLHANLRWAARLATTEDAASVAEQLWAAPAQFADLAWLGRPVDVAPLIACLAHAEALIAVTAGTAFTYLTGIDIAGPQRVRLPPTNEDEATVAVGVRLPDAQRAQRAWHIMQPQLADARRIAHGLEVIDPQHPYLPRTARRDLLLRRCRAG